MQDNEQLKQRFAEKIKENREVLAHSVVDYSDVRKLKEQSDEISMCTFVHTQENVHTCDSM